MSCATTPVTGRRGRRPKRRWCCSSAQQLAGAEIRVGLGEAAEHGAHDLDRIHLVGRNGPHAEPPRRALPIGGPHLLAVRHRGDAGVEQPPAVVVEEFTLMLATRTW